MAKEKRVDFIIGAKDESKAVVARTRENIKREMKQIEAETRNLRIGGGNSVAERKGILGMRDADTTAARTARAAQLRALRAEARGISDQENAVRREINAQAQAAQRKAIADEAKARLDGAESGGAMKSLKSQLGEESALGNLAKAARGAGAVAGAAVLTQILEQTTGKAAELANQYRKGEISAGEMTEQLARSVPILGNAWAAGRNLKEAFTGAAVEAEKLLKYEKLRLAASQQLGERLQKFREMRRGTADVVFSNRQRIDMAGREGASAQLAGMDNSYQAERRQLGQEREDAIKAINSDPARAAQLHELYAKTKDPNNANNLAGINKEIENIERQRQNEIDRTNGQFDEKAKSNLRRYNAERKALKEKLAREEAQITRDARRGELRAEQQADLEQLERQGQYQQAHRQSIMQAYQEELQAAREQREKELREGFTSEAANQNFDARVNAAGTRRQAALDGQREADARDLADFRRGNDQSNLQGDAGLAARKARLAGNDKEAAAIERRASLQSELAEIERRATEDKRRNAERAGEIDAQAKREAARAMEGSLLSGIEDERQRARQFGPADDNIFKGENRMLTGVTNTKGATDNFAKMPDNIGKAVAESLKAQLDNLEPMARNIMLLAQKLEVI